MPFGLTNAPATFQSCMNNVFRRRLRRFVLVFFDDILIYNRTWEKHLQHLEEVLRILEEQQFYAKLSNYEFDLTEMLYVGHIIGTYGVKLAVPLTDLTKRGAFAWKNGAQTSFDHLKEVMSNCPVLALPDFSQPFTMECDASGEGVGAVLSQDGHPIAFESRKLLPHERSYSIYDKEMLAIMHALAKF
eukprot:PITA_09489